jgi:gliding motility-associated-like protein
LSINPITLADAATNYNVVVTGLCPSAQTSLDVALSVQTPPSITTQPLPQTLCLGAAATMSVAATGTGLSYQWRKGNVNLIDGANISGSNTAILSINPSTLADAATNYNVVVTGLCPSAQTSLDVALSVQTPPSITTQPLPQTLCLGAAATMSVAATGSGLSYQWRKGNVNLIDGANISGSNTAILSINPSTLADAATNYNVVVTGLCPSAQTSLDVALSVQTPPSITTQPLPQTLCLGAAATMSVAATGSGLSYQWRKGNVNLIDGANISGSNTAILSINPTTLTDAATNYNVVVTGICPTEQTSLDAELTLQTSPSIGTQPNPQTVCLGAAATMSVAATGSGLSYQWRKGNVNLFDDANISGSNTAILSINPTTLTDAATNYNVVVTGVCPTEQTSLDAALVVPDLTQVVILTDTIACIGEDLLLQATAIDSLTYLWVGPNDFSSDLSNPILTNVNATQAGSYQLLVSLQGCTSNPIFLNLNLANCDTTDFFIPEGFSPNQDGINDLFVIRGIQDYPQSKLLVYSRWGDKLFEADAYANNWDGTSSFGLTVGSDLLPIGNYFYILQLNNSADEVFKGVIYLSR